MKQKFANALSLALIVAMFFTSVALAENVKNDVVVGGNDTFTAPGSTTINYWIQDTGQPNTCEAADGTTVSITINVPSGVTATPSSLIFNKCNTNNEATPTNTQSVVFSSSTPGSYLITATATDTGDPSAYNVSSAAFTLIVIQPQNTAPAVSISGVTDGASYEIGSVPAASCNVVDAEDGDSSFPATLSGITGPLAAYGLGSQTASCSYTDGGGLPGSASATYSIVDTTDPVITFVSRTSANGNGWNNGDVTVIWSCSDSGSGVVNSSVSQTVSTEGANQSATGTCEDVAGNTASDTETGINIDKTQPSASASATPGPNTNGWNNTDVVISFTGTDGLSGVDTCSAPVTLSDEGANQSASGTCTDKAGNVSALATGYASIDKTDPLVSLLGGPADGGTYYFGFVPAAPTCDASDALSGLDGSCSVSGYSDATGNHTVTTSATDKAGNSASDSADYTVNAWTLNGFYQPVDMDKLNTVKGGSTVPLKFEVFAGPTELTSTSVVMSFVQTRVACDTSAPIDEIEVTSTGGTSLRYDATAGQFIQNWQTPKQAGACYRVTMTTQDGSFLQTFFKLK